MSHFNGASDNCLQFQMVTKEAWDQAWQSEPSGSAWLGLARVRAEKTSAWLGLPSPHLTSLRCCSARKAHKARGCSVRKHDSRYFKCVLYATIGNEDENDNGSEDWKIEDDDKEDEDEDDEDDEEADDPFEEGIVNASDSEILYGKDGNIIGEEDIGGGLK